MDETNGNGGVVVEAARDDQPSPTTTAADVSVQLAAPIASKLDAAAALRTLRGFLSQQQLRAIDAGCWSDDRQFFYDKLVELADIVRTMPKTYEQDGKCEEAIAYLHYFSAGADWYITEKDLEREQHQAYGQADLGHGPECGYISLVELMTHGVELDFHFSPKTLAEINHITLSINPALSPSSNSGF
ncbi:MAG: hypothetical protein ABIW82_16925 [Dokdonella sp.]